MPIEPHDPEEFDSSFSPLPIFIAEDQRRVSKGKRALRIVGGFLLGQGASQAVGVVSGFVLVHILSVEAYAQFGIATAFQGVFTILMDVGFAATIVPLVGDRGHDRGVIGRYVRAARHLRDRSFWILAPVASIAFFATVHAHHWSWRLQSLLLASVLVSLYSSGVFSFFSAPLFLLGRLREYYVPQVLSGTARLLIYAVLAVFGGLNAWTAAALGALSITLNSILVRRSSMKHLDWPTHDDPEANRELLRYVLPATPSILFSAFQSQLSLFLISVFGGTLYLAQVAALSRIGQLFLVLMTFNTIIVEPYVARIPRDRLLRIFVGFILLAVIACIPILLVAFLWPQGFLWILGPKYASLSSALGWYMLSACMNFVSGLVWIMNRARKWVFWSGSFLEVALLLGVQVAFFILIGVRTTQQAVLFAIASSCCYMVAHGYVAVRGFVRGS